MRWTSVVCLCVLAAHLVSSYPVDDTQASQGRETLSSLEDSLGKPTSEHSDRDKRTIGVLRRIFPELSKIIDDKIQQLTSVIFRIVGRFVLGGGALGGGGGGNGGDGGRRVSITLPTYPPDEDEDEDTEPPSNTETSTDSNDISEDSTGEPSRKRRAAEEVAESEKKEVRVPADSQNDLKAAATGDDSDEAESAEVSDEIDDSGENSRPKRLGVFGNLFSGSSGASGSSSGGSSSGGSGNFLFDIIRRTADGAARAAGTVYRMVAGTDSDSGLLTPDATPAESAQTTSKSNSDPQPTPRQVPAPKDLSTTLVAGSGATEQQDENANAPNGDQGTKEPSDDGYQAGIPGPITRLFVIANRGIANLIQDLILRLAQTSERIVNFKARLITAII